MPAPPPQSAAAAPEFRPEPPPAQGSLFADPPTTTPQAPAPSFTADDGIEYRPGELAPVWLQRLNLFIHVMFCLYLGVIVAILPWWRNVWDRNLFLLAHPALWRFLMLGVVRGVISGLGLLDIWIGLSEAIHYRDVRASQLPPPRAEK